MAEYLEASSELDFLPVAAGRTFPAPSQPWLRDYEPVAEHKLRREDLASLRISGQRQWMGQLSPGDRSMKLDLTLERLVSVDEEIEDSETRKKEITKIATDSLILAHEVGGKNYPYGHGAALLDPRWAHPNCLFDQDVFNQGALLLVSEMNSRRFPENTLQFISQPIQSFHFDEWFYEMLAILSQRKRLSEYLSIGWHPYTAAKVKSWYDDLGGLGDHRHGRPRSVYEIAGRIWKGLQENQGAKATRVLDAILNYVLISPVLETRPGSVGFWLAPPSQVMLATLEMESNFAGNIEGQLRDIVASAEGLGQDAKFEAYNRIEGMAIYQSTWKANATLFGEDSTLALHFGSLWIALNSLVWITELRDNAGTTRLLVNRNAKTLFTAETLRLATSIIQLRQLLLEPIRLSFPFDSDVERARNLASYIDKDISLEEFQSKDYRWTGRLAHPPVGSENFAELPKKLKRYYLSHKMEIEEWMRDPAGHIKTYLSKL